jgi:2-iminobutanoate/2-iminopropanoate deaminase
MKRTVTATEAPAAIGPYSQAIIAQKKLVFTAGQLGLDPKSGQLVGKTAAEQARQALKNLLAILNTAGSGPQYAVKTTIFLADMNDFANVNQVYGEFFPDPYPARSTVQVARLPKDALVEIECIAVVP